MDNAKSVMEVHLAIHSLVASTAHLFLMELEQILEALSENVFARLAISLMIS